MNNTIFADALINGTEYANIDMSADVLGYKNAREWSTLIKAAYRPAYNYRKAVFEGATKEGYTSLCKEESALFDVVRPIVDTIGEVNGIKLNVSSVAKEISYYATRFVVVATSVEAAEADFALKKARAEKDDDAIENAMAVVDELRSKAGNYKRIIKISSESSFIRNVNTALSLAITRFAMATVEEIDAEKAARKAVKKATK